MGQNPNYQPPLPQNPNYQMQPNYNAPPVYPSTYPNGPAQQCMNPTQNQPAPIVFQNNLPRQAQTQVPVIVSTTREYIIFGDHPINMTCPNCKRKIRTAVEKEVGVGNVAACAGCCVLCGPFGLCALCIPDLMDTKHSCPCCKILLAERIGC